MAQPASPAAAPPSIDRLLVLAADHPAAVLTQLAAHPALASQQDAHGYSLVHAAASYAHADLLTALVRTYAVDPNLRDEDGETALFSVEEVAMARLLLALGTDPALTNHDGQTAAEKLDDEDEQPAVAAFLRGEGEGEAEAAAGATNGHDAHPHPPPPLPHGVQVNVGTMDAADVGELPDPEFRRRIEELAARPDFDQESGQRELRSLIEDAVSGLTGDGQGQGAATRLRRE